MDGATSRALTFGVVVLAVALGLLYTTRPAGEPGDGLAVPSTGSIIETLRSKAGLIALLIPYTLIFGLPLIDLYNREFKYSLLAVVGASSAIVGFGLQYLIRGGGTFLPAITVATSAMITFYIRDAWACSSSTTYKMMTTLAGVVLIAVQAMSSPPSQLLFTNPMMNDLTTVLLGAGLGMISWITVWNVARRNLPHTIILTEKKKA